MYFKYLKKDHFGVYILIKDKKPVYAGCTSNILQRIKSHRVTKDFDDYIILKQYKPKKEALIAERSIIRFLSVFGDDTVLNGKIDHLTDILNYTR